MGLDLAAATEPFPFQSQPLGLAILASPDIMWVSYGYYDTIGQLTQGTACQGMW